MVRDGDLGRLVTESGNPRSEKLDALPTVEMLRVINTEDATVAGAVGEVIPKIAVVVDAVAAALRAGGCVHQFGAGTSGRLAVLDAAEWRPTFGVEEGVVQGHVAGGRQALTRAVEGAEDDEKAGEEAVFAAGVEKKDLVIVLTASGRAPWCLGVLRAAGKRGAYTVAVTCNRLTPCHDLARVTIDPIVGSEVLAGSTRMKAGTAQKMVLNMISTGAMVKAGRTYGNLMVALTATNAKLKARARRLVARITGSEAGVEELLESAGWDVRKACVMRVKGVSAVEAGRVLERCGGVLRRALEG